MLAWFRAAILLASFKRLTKVLERRRAHLDSRSLDKHQLSQASCIGNLVASAARHTPWQSLCLVQVLVVQRMLVKRGICGQIYLGACRGAETSTGHAGFSAHAWLQCGDVIVNGAAGHKNFTVVSVFSWAEN